ncbi:MAG: glycosyltransferase 87 family protein, partial [Acidimicrobiales bacterium]
MARRGGEPGGAASRAALVVGALAMAGVLLRGPRGATGFSLVLLVVAFVSLAALVGAERRRRCLTRGLVLGVSGVLLVLAVVVPPTESADLWSYAMYGRMVSEYRESPYRHTPEEYRDDPIRRRVPAFWVDSRSVYGPLFTVAAAAGMTAAGHSALRARLFFQGLAALAVGAVLVLVDRRTRDPVALALIGINPVVVVSVVNGGHNDALVGLAVLGGALLVVRRRPAWAGALLAAGALVKVAALLPLAAVAVWVWCHHGRREAAALAGTAAGVGLAGLVAAGAPAVIDALSEAQTRVNGGSIWAGPRR